VNRHPFCGNLLISTLQCCHERSWGRKTYFHTVASSRRRWCAPSPTGQCKLDRGHSRGRHIDCTRRIMMPRLGVSRLDYMASIRNYWAGAAEMELTESRGRLGPAIAAPALAFFGEAAWGREIVQVRGSIPPTSSPLQPWRHSPGRAAPDRFANACRAAFAETAPKGRCSRRASS
jgi:hypothetical protein